ncbi:MAG: hypothetical protein WCC52_08910 [Nitrosotalea sp.]
MKKEQKTSVMRQKFYERLPFLGLTTATWVYGDLYIKFVNSAIPV